MILNLYADIESIEFLAVNKDIVGLRVYKTGSVYDIDKQLFDKFFEVGVLERVRVVLHKQVYSTNQLHFSETLGMYVTNKEERTGSVIRQCSTIPLNVKKLILNLLVISNQKNSSGDNDVIAIGCSPAEFGLDRAIPEKFMQFQGKGMQGHGVEFYKENSEHTIIKIVGESEKRNSFEDRYNISNVCFSIKTMYVGENLEYVSEGKEPLDYSFCLNIPEPNRVYEFGCRTAIVWEIKSPHVEYIKLLHYRVV